jgi:hypothetical protein
MKKSLLVKLASLLLATLMLSGCFVRVEDDEFHHRGHYERDRGEHHEHHEDHGDHH